METKCYSPCVATHRAGAGTRTMGGSPQSVGGESAFGNTEEHLLLEILGCKQMGTPNQPPLNHLTGKGYVRARTGYYDDALTVKHSVVIALITECFGGIAPAAFARLLENHKATREPNALDRTKYGKLRARTKSYLTHHLRRTHGPS